MIRIDAFSVPQPYDQFAALLSEIAVTVIGFDGSPTTHSTRSISVRAIRGDVDCNGTVNGQDIADLIRLVYNRALRVSCGAFDRGVGADANQDGRQTSADLTASVGSSRACPDQFPDGVFLDKARWPKDAGRMTIAQLLGRWRFGIGALLVIILACSGEPAALASCKLDQYCCSGGSNNANVCTYDSDCPGGGACLFPAGICTGGTADGTPYCTKNSDCPGGTRSATQRLCSGGDNRGFPCTTITQCPGSGANCVANGMFCFGGSFDHLACVSDATAKTQRLFPALARRQALRSPNSRSALLVPKTE